MRSEDPDEHDSKYPREGRLRVYLGEAPLGRLPPTLQHPTAGPRPSSSNGTQEAANRERETQAHTHTLQHVGVKHLHLY